MPHLRVERGASAVAAADVNHDGTDNLLPAFGRCTTSARAAAPRRSPSTGAGAPRASEADTR
jgi:hypothetical protein